MTALLAALGAALATYLVRILLITLVPASRLPAAVGRLLPHVGPAVLAALVVAALFRPSGAVQPAFLVGAALTGAVAWWRGSVVLAMGVGLCAVAACQLI